MPVYYLWLALSFWPQFFWYHFGKQAKGCSVWLILTDPKDQSSTARKLRNHNPVGWFHPIWSRYMVFTAYQVHGAYAHLHQHQNQNVEGSIVELAGPAQPWSWDPLRLAIPYEYLSARVCKPPDCCLAKLLTILLLLGLYTVPLVRGATYLSCLRIHTLLGDSAATVKFYIALTTTPRS
jgi:hypothetical protein